MLTAYVRFGTMKQKTHLQKRKERIRRHNRKSLSGRVLLHLHEQYLAKRERAKSYENQSLNVSR